jgi:hemerythrin superfamily protein
MHPNRELGPKPTSDEGTARAVFSQAHDRLERHFQSILGEASSGDLIARRAAWRDFEKELLGHFEDEELHILPAFALHKPIEATALLDEHKRIRVRLTKLGLDLDLRRLPAERIADFVAALRAHARHEDDLLYPWAARRLANTASEQIRRELSTTEQTPRSDRDEAARSKRGP